MRASSLEWRFRLGWCVLLLIEAIKISTNLLCGGIEMGTCKMRDGQQFQADLFHRLWKAGFTAPSRISLRTRPPSMRWISIPARPPLARVEDDGAWAVMPGECAGGQAGTGWKSSGMSSAGAMEVCKHQVSRCMNA